MANFCMYCGRPLKEGETCHCREEGYDHSSQEETPEFAEEYPEFAQEDDSYYSSQNEEEIRDEDDYYSSQNEEEPQEDEEYYNDQPEEDYPEDDDYYVSQNEEEPSEDEEYYYSQDEEEAPEAEEYYYSQDEEESPEAEEYYYSQDEEESSEAEEYYYSQDEEESSEAEEYYYSQDEEESPEGEEYYYSQDEEESPEGEEYYYGQDEEESPEGEEYYHGQQEEDLQQEDEYYYNQEDESYYDQETDHNDMINEEELSEGKDIGEEEQEKVSSKDRKRKEKEKKRKKVGKEKNAKQRETRHRESEKEQKNAQGEAAGLFETMHMVSIKMGNALDKVYNFVTPTDKPGRIVNGVDGRKLLGLSKEDKVAQVEDCYERGLQIVPDLIQPCGQEIPIRQYDICATRSLLKGTWQEGRLQVTNKRVLFRLSGRNWIGKMQKSVEFALDDVTGIDIRNGNRLSFVALFLNVYYAALFSALGTLLTQYVEILAIILGIAGALGISILLRKHYYAKLAVFAFAFAPMNTWMQEDESIQRIVALLILVGFALYFILASIRPNFSFKILTKSGGTSPIEEKRVDTVPTMLFNYFIARGMDVLPGKDAERAMDEVGTMIMDIQKFGDFGIQKWKMD